MKWLKVALKPAHWSCLPWLVAKRWILKTAVGQWYLLDAPIMGYRHDESAQRVLRLTRYRTPPTDTKGYGNLYQLDSVIETKTLAK